MTDMTDLVTLFPRQRVPPLDVGLADGGTFDIAAEKPASFTLIVFYRGLHCPICKTQLRELVVPGNYVTGRLVGSTQLSSGRFAMIDDSLGFSLVPWRPALEQHIGRHISGIAIPGGGVDWSFARPRGLGL